MKRSTARRQFGNKRVILVLLAATWLCFSLPEVVSADLSSSSTFQYFDQTTGHFVTLSNKGNTSSSVTIDSNNLAHSFLNPLSETMGAEVRSTIFGGDALTTSRHTDGWFCPNTTCGAVVGLNWNGPVVLSIQLAGTVVGDPTTTFHDFQANYAIGLGDSFSFSLSSDSTPLSTSATFRNASGASTNVPVTLTTDANGNTLFSVDFTVQTPLCAPVGCPSFAGVSSASNPVFTDVQSIRAEVTAGHSLDALDAFHTFGVSVVSLDPTLSFLSADGRSMQVTPPVPEPSSLLLLGTGLLGVVGAARRKWLGVV
jgi:PEP-CTERM motif